MTKYYSSTISKPSTRRIALLLPVTPMSRRIDPVTYNGQYYAMYYAVMTATDIMWQAVMIFVAATY